MATNTLLYTAEVDFPNAADLDPFVEWYAYRHAPDLFKLGFKSCASYRAVEGGMNIMDIYDMDSSAVFESTGYCDMSAVKDPYVKSIMRNARREAATIYTQRVVHPKNTVAIPLLDADWILMLRFEALAAADREIIGWLSDEEGPRQAKLGATCLRYGWRSYDHPVLPTHRPRCILLAEWPTRPETRLKELEEKFGDKVSPPEIYVGYRLYPWADRPLNERDGSRRR
ncbi:MAG: hypothetical protein AB7S71_11060 [Dongiaceae bacterium]